MTGEGLTEQQWAKLKLFIESLGPGRAQRDYARNPIDFRARLAKVLYPRSRCILPEDYTAEAMKWAQPALAPAETPDVE